MFSLDHPIQASALDGCFLFKVTHKTEPIQMTINNHTEHIIFFVQFHTTFSGFGNLLIKEK